jgi:hypothetical protein
MTAPVSSTDRASALVTAAVRVDRPAFGRAYQAILEPSLDVEAVTVLFGFIRDSYHEVAAAEGGAAEDPDGDETIDRVHRLSLLAYQSCSELMEINLVVLEHVFRSVLAMSDYLESVDGYTVAWYLAVLAGGLYQACRDGGIELHSPLARQATAVLSGIEPEATR